MLWIRALRLGVNLLAAALLCVAAAPSVAAATKKPLEWRVLLIIKAKGDIATTWMPNVQYQMSPEEIRAATFNFTVVMPEFVRTLSNGHLSWKSDVFISPEPLVKVDGNEKGTAINPTCIQEDLKKHMAPGKYDGIFVLWRDRDDRTKASLKGGFGWTIVAENAYQGAGFSCVNYCVSPKDLMKGEVFLHEWLHQLESYYGSRGAPLPKGGLHGNANYGFKEDRDGSWKSWYRAFINAELRNSDGRQVGLGERVWLLGTMRDDINIRQPEFMTKARRRTNLLKNPSFDDGETGWTTDGAANALTIGDDAQPARKQTARLQSSSGKEVTVVQKVKVQPNCRYLLTGWVRAADVPRGDEQDGRPGAQLWVSHKRRFERKSDFVVGNHDWFYRAVVFGSGDRKEVEVGVRTGGGTAWFDDLVLIKLGELLAPQVPTSSKAK